MHGLYSAIHGFFSDCWTARDETGEMNRQTNALIHGWGKYRWMINFYEWGATYAAHLLKDYQVKGDKRQVFGPDCLLDELP